MNNAKGSNCHTKLVKSVRRKDKMFYNISYMWSLKNNTSEFIYKTTRLTNVEIKFMVITKGGRKDNKLGVWD